MIKKIVVFFQSKDLVFLKINYGLSIPFYKKGRYRISNLLFLRKEFQSTEVHC